MTMRLLLGAALAAGAIALGCGGDPAARAVSREAVRVTGPGTLAVEPDSVFGKKLELVTLRPESVAFPVFSVTGSVSAAVRPGDGDREDRWQFASSEVQSAWADWRRTRGEIAFDERQLQASRELAQSRVKAQTAVVERLRKLVAIGSDSQKDLALEEANLAEARLEGQKETFAAESALVQATRTAAGLERQLLQAGVDPRLLAAAPETAVLVVAEVPEAAVDSVRTGQACSARFYAISGTVFSGKVLSLGPAVSRERRTLPALFELDDAGGRLRPGMFADIGIGGEARDTLLLPADSVLHVGRDDYVIVAGEPGAFKVAAVHVGDSHEGRLQAVDGVKAGDRVVGSAAILLKPYVAAALSR